MPYERQAHGIFAGIVTAQACGGQYPESFKNESPCGHAPYLADLLDKSASEFSGEHGA